MDTTNSPCSGDQHIQTKVIQQFADAAYIALRPTFEYGDHTVMACFREAEAGFSEEVVCMAEIRPSTVETPDLCCRRTL